MEDSSGAASCILVAARTVDELLLAEDDHLACHLAEADLDDGHVGKGHAGRAFGLVLDPGDEACRGEKR